jgi:hypothetical protein
MQQFQQPGLETQEPLCWFFEGVTTALSLTALRGEAHASWMAFSLQ